ncbi:MAG: methyl-accepting chemotaxis protein [Nitrospirae bacterium]|nr:methyl-accepting chemotaxis protein [Nitrospirota bacterium]
MIRPKNTLVTNFIGIMLLILIVGQGILYTWLLLYQKVYLEKRLMDEVMATAGHIADMTAATGADAASLDRFLDVLLKGGLILSVKVTDGGGRLVAAKGVTGEAKKEGFGPFVIFYIPTVNTLSIPLKADTTGAGNVEVVYSGHSVNEVMRRFLVIPPIMQSVTFFFVILAIAKFFQRKVSRPVESINSALARITAGDLTVEVPGQGDKEIGSIAKGLQFLVETLSTTIARINSLSGNVAAAMGQLTVILNNVGEAARKQSRSVDDMISAVRAANDAQARTTENADKLSLASSENVSSLLEMRSAAEEIASSTGRLFKSAGDSYAMIAEMSQTSKAIAESAGEVSRAVENTSSSVEEISASLNAVRENTRKSSELTSQVRMLLTDRGTHAVADAIEAMEEIVEEVDHSAKIITTLEERSKNIEKILSVIREVTEKTNLLSLNAAILAAQAGEYGKGFSVVADEIRSLSDRTSSSARDIAGIVRTIQSEIHEAVTSISSGVKKVEEGKDLIMRTGEAIGETVEAAQKSSRMATVVEKATEEQAEGLKQIRLSMENVRVMIEQVAKATDEERKGSSHMLDSISDVKEVAEIVKKGTEEHAGGTNVISRNLELTQEMVSQISRSAQNQKKVNEGIVGAVEQMKKAGLSTVRDLEEVTVSFNTLRDEVEVLKREMESFKTGNPGKEKGPTG